MNLTPLPLKRLGLSLTLGLTAGAAIAWFSPGDFWTGWLAASFLLVPAAYALILAWAWGGKDTALAWMVALAFLLRLISGIGLSLALPVWGYDEPEQKAGYLFQDAYERDRRAWDLAHSSQPLWVSFQDDVKTDQYGGLLALSVGLYRYLSPDAHRPFLIVALGAWFAALGIPFLRQAARLHWSERTAALAAWIVVFYPDAVFFASSQMREPFLVGLSAIALWGVLSLQGASPLHFPSFTSSPSPVSGEKGPGEERSLLFSSSPSPARGRRGRGLRVQLPSWLALIASLAGMALFSTRVAVMLAGMLAILFLLGRVLGRSGSPSQGMPFWKGDFLGWLALVVGVALVLVYSWGWFRSASRLDAVVTQQEVGRLDAAIDELSDRVGEWVSFPVILVYGLAQPVFPAAVMSLFRPNTAPFWQAVAMVRATGWYALAPFLLYGFFCVWREPRPQQRRMLVGLALSIALWLLIASARGGGDLTDNPRYRSLLLVWMALLAAWAIDWALLHRDAWLWRWIAIEVIFLGFFTHWYITRVFRVGSRLPFWVMVSVILACSALVLAGGWLRDRFYRPK